MSSSVKGLIAGIAAVVLLGGGILAMKLTEPEPEVADESVSDETDTEIYSKNMDDISSIKVTNENGGYVLKRTHKSSGEDDETTFSIEGLEKVNLNNATVNNVPSNAAVLDAVRVIDEDAADLSKYGLSEPKAEAEINFDGDSSEKINLLVGNDTPGGDVYVCLKGENKVYSVSSSSVSSYTVEKEYFISLTLVEEPAEEDYPIISSVKVERTDLDYDIVFEYSGEDESGGTTATHVMTSPVNAYLNVSDSVNYTHGIFGIKAMSVLSISPSEDELKVAHLDEPVCTVTTTLEDGSSYVLKIGIQYGNDESIGYIGMLDGIDILWQFSSDEVPWVNMKPEDAMSSLVFGSYIYDLKSMDIDASGEKIKFEFEGNDADSYSVKLNGETFGLDRYMSFYQALIKAPAEEICLSDEGIGERLASFTLKYNNGNPDETIEFFRAENKKLIIKKNGETCFKCRSSFADKALLPNIENIDGEGGFVTNW